MLSSYGFGVPVKETPEAVCAQVARLLREAREERGYSLSLVAQKSGLARQTITFVEQEERTPNLDTLLRLAAALDVDLEVIIARARKTVSARLK